jgi:hypothetical protein
MNEDRGPWYLLTGLVIGIVLGLVYAWRINPVVYENTSPVSMRVDYKDRYRALIAAAFAADGNLARAQARLKLLADEDPARAVAIQAQRALAENQPEAEARALGLLAEALSPGSLPPQPTGNTGSATPPAGSTPTQTPGAAAPTGEASQAATLQASPGASLTPSLASISSTQNPTITPLPSRTPTPTRGAPFVLQDKRPVCDASLGQPLIMVEAFDAAGNPVPGAEVIVAWEGNEDRFFTGLKPELGLGYADFTMTPGVTYTLHLAEGGEPVADLAANECETASKERFWGSWRIVFVQP